MTKQYIDLCEKIVDEGVWVENKRTGKRCLTIIDHNLEYDVAKGEFPLVTTRKSFWKAAVAEMIGYLRGYDNAADFRDLGARTWDANANENADWLKNPARKGEDDMGYVYGKVARNYPVIDKDMQVTFMDTIRKVYEDLKAGVDDRGEIISFWMPGVFELGCLRPCMYEHHFSILDGTLYLNSTQRSCDVLLGGNFNMVQCYFLLAIMAQITGLKPGKVRHKLINAHFYEDQYETYMNEQRGREPLESGTFHINPEIRTLEDLETWVTLDDFEVTGYEHHDAVKYAFSV